MNKEEEDSDELRFRIPCPIPEPAARNDQQMNVMLM
jgi:hypothetical protein